MRIKLFAQTLAIAVLAFGLSGCAGYHVGSMLPPDIKTVYVPTFVNKTREPLLEVETTAAVLEEIQNDGSLQLANKEDADAILDVTLTHFSLDPVSYRRESSTKTAAREYRLTITVSYMLRRRADDSIVSEAPSVSGDAVFELIGDLSSSKLRGIPLTSTDLAHKIVERLVETW
ncbi:MAG: LptE family protein [bacterium]